MKVSVTALFILLVMTFSSLASSILRSPNFPQTCCISYVDKQIPRKLVTDYFETSSTCFQPGVVFLTKKDQTFCANPSETWVQSYVKELSSEEWGSDTLDKES